VAPRSRRPDLRRTGAWAALALLTWAALEGLCLAALFALARGRGLDVPLAARFHLDPVPRERLERVLAGREPYYPFDAELGWSVRPNGRLPLYRANAQGIRSDAEYAPEPPRGALRIAAFGDSFVHGTEVENPDVWTARLERLHPGLEVLNFGVGGYGVDQAWLRYRRDGRPFRPHLVAIGFLPENVARSVNRFRPFYAPRQSEPRAKPRFVLRDGGLALLPNPLPTLDAYRALLADEPAVLARVGEDDFFWETLWRPAPLSILPSARLLRFARASRSDARIWVDGVVNPRSEAFAVTAAVLEAFYDDALTAGSLPLVLVFPRREDFSRREQGAPDAWAPLRERLAASGVESLELIGCFERPRWLRGLTFMKGGHYGPPLHRVVARCVLETLEARGWLSPDAMPAAVAAARARRALAGPPPVTR